MSTYWLRLGVAAGLALCLFAVLASAQPYVVEAYYAGGCGSALQGSIGVFSSGVCYRSNFQFTCNATTISFYTCTVSDGPCNCTLSESTSRLFDANGHICFPFFCVRWRLIFSSFHLGHNSVPASSLFACSCTKIKTEPSLFSFAAAPINTCVSSLGGRRTSLYTCVSSPIDQIEQSLRRPNNETVVNLTTRSEGPDCTPGVNPTVSYELTPPICRANMKRSVGAAQWLGEYAYTTCNLTHSLLFNCNDSACADCKQSESYPRSCSRGPGRFFELLR